MSYRIDVSGIGVVITGASRGLGRALAEGFSECGATVFNADLVPAEKGPDRQQENGGIIDIQTDITDYRNVEKMVERATAIHQINILINNAGVIYKAPAEDMDMRQWQKVLDVNLTGAMHCTRALIPYLKKQKLGRIINICSMQSFIGSRTYSAYTATKSALSGLTRVWATELAEQGITVNGICPSFIDTPMLRSAIQKYADLNELTYEQAYQAFIGQVPQKRVLKPEEIVFVALFLASPLAQSLTGQNIITSGGMVMN